MLGNISSPLRLTLTSLIKHVQNLCMSLYVVFIPAGKKASNSMKTCQSHILQEGRATSITTQESTLLLRAREQGEQVLQHFKRRQIPKVRPTLSEVHTAVQHEQSRNHKANVKIHMYFPQDGKSPQVHSPCPARLIYNTRSICYQDKLSYVLQLLPNNLLSSVPSLGR